MKNQKIKPGIGKAIIFFFLFCTLKVAAQSTNPNQSNINSQNNSQNQNSSGRTNEHNNNINNPYITPPQDSVNRVRSNEPDRPTHQHAKTPGAFELQEQVRHQSGQNQMTAPPNAAGPDTNMRQIPPAGKRNTSLPDSNYRIEPTQVNPTIMGSPTDSVK